MALTASKLREDIYNILDSVLDTGIPVEIERNGRKLVITPEVMPSRLARLAKAPELMKGDPEELVHMDWSGEWSG